MKQYLNPKLNFSYRSGFFIMVIILLVLSNIHMNTLLAQSTIQEPEYASFEPVDATDMVNLLTGDFAYVLPILNVPGPEGGYPLALHYHAGIPVDAEASWVGLGWNINAGVINRNIKGYPDDWNAVETHILQNLQGEIEEQYNTNLSYLNPYTGLSVNLHANWGCFKAFGGNVAFMSSNSNTGVFATYQGGNLTMDASVNGIGLSFFTSSNSNIQNSAAASSNSLESIGIQGTTFLDQDHVGIPLVTPKGIIKLEYSHYKYYSYMLSKEARTAYGTLYTNKASKNDEDDRDIEGVQDWNYVMDVYTNPYDETTTTPLENELNNSLAFPNYDSYNVAAQGISSSMSPYLMEYGTLSRGGVVIEYRNNDYALDLYDWEDKRSFCYFNYDNFEDVADKKVNFYLRNHQGSSFSISSPTFSHTDAQAPIAGLSQSGGVLSTDGIYQNNRLGTSNYVEWFTNDEIVNNRAVAISKGFIETASIMDDDSDPSTDPRANGDFFDPDGIGAFSITAPDGKTYHFSLPVYQFESFRIVEDQTKEDAFRAESRPGMYAYTWLLTAITGPDYLDDGDGFVNENDYGYWVKFDYGKWSDGYVWRNPYSGTEQGLGEDMVAHAMGRKQLYYLNSIETKTHVAYFIKELREDAVSSNVGASNLDVTTDYSKEYRDNLENQLYSCLLSSGVNIIQLSYKRRLRVAYNNANNCRKLKLSKIILLPKNTATVNKVGGNEIITKQTGHLTFSETIIDPRGTDLLSGIQGIQLNTYASCFNLIKEEYGEYDNSKTFELYYPENVLDIGDIDLTTMTNLEASATKILDFKYDYSLSPGNPTSKNFGENGDLGKLTLNGVNILGNNGVKTMPGYSFYYSNESYTSEQDEWGYADSNPLAWSLQQIKTPLGEVINVGYEEDSYKTEIIFDSEPAVGGGLRVSEISSFDELNMSGSTVKYIYSNYNGTSSGVTSYVPSRLKENEFIPYVYEIPGPGVMYENVTVENWDATEMKDYTIFTYNVLDNGTLDPQYSWQLGDFIKVEETQEPETAIQSGSYSNDYGGTTSFEMFSRSAIIHNYTSILGTLKNSALFNIDGNLISNTKYTYQPAVDDKAIIKETFNDIRRNRYWHNAWETCYTPIPVRCPVSHTNSTDTFWINGSSRKIYPVFLTKVETQTQNQVTSDSYSDFDNLTGTPHTTITLLSDGKEIKSENVPAYTLDVYSGNATTPGMGTKIINENNANMLTQEAASYSYLNIGSSTNPDWQPTGSAIQTWNGDWNNYWYYDAGYSSFVEGNPYPTAPKVWRKHQNYIWKGDIYEDGTYDWTKTGDEFEELFDFSLTDNDAGWTKTSEITRYNLYSTAVETKDIYNKYASTKVDENNRVISSAANASFHEFVYSGAEDKELDNNTHLASGVKKGGGTVSSSEAHTGNKSLSVGNGSNGFTYETTIDSDWNTNRDFIMMVWVKGTNLTDDMLNCSAGTEGTQTSFTAKQWTLLTRKVSSLPTSGTVTFSCTNNTSETVYFDDFRVQPLTAVVSAYSYDKLGNVIAILDNNNFATKYEYYDDGKLKSTFKETPDGFKKVSEYEYKYKNNLLSPTSLSFAPTISTQGVVINTEGSWEVAEWPNFITNVSPSSGSGNNTVSVTCAVNNGIEGKEGIMKFLCNGESGIVRVYQDGTPDYLTVDKTSLSFIAEGDQEVNLHCSSAWVITINYLSGSNWLRVAPAVGLAGDYDLKVSVLNHEPNNSAEVKVQSDVGVRYITVVCSDN